MVIAIVGWIDLRTGRIADDAMCRGGSERRPGMEKLEEEATVGAVAEVDYTVGRRMVTAHKVATDEGSNSTS